MEALKATSIALSEQARQFRMCLPLVVTEGNKLADPLSADGITAKVEFELPRSFTLRSDVPLCHDDYPFCLSTNDFFARLMATCASVRPIVWAATSEPSDPYIV